MTGSLEVRTIDFSPFHEVTDTPTSAQLSVAAEIDQCCRTVGFVHLTNVGISQEVYDKAFKGARSLFDLRKKSNLSQIDPETNAGYSPFRTERINSSRGLDLKESFNVKFPPHHVNNFTACPDEFVDASEQLLVTFYSLAERYSYACALALGLTDEMDFFSSSHTQMNGCAIRYNHYPPVNERKMWEWIEPNRKPAIRAGEHRDFGLFTFLLLAPGALEGLQVLPPSRGGIEANFKNDQDWKSLRLSSGDSCGVSVIVNTGLLMARWTNDLWPATPHRVIVPSREAAFTDRYSIACFAHPDADSVVDVHPKFVQEGQVKKYGPTTAKDFLTTKLRELHRVDEKEKQQRLDRAHNKRTVRFADEDIHPKLTEESQMNKFKETSMHEYRIAKLGLEQILEYEEESSDSLIPAVEILPFVNRAA